MKRNYVLAASLALFMGGITHEAGAQQRAQTISDTQTTAISVSGGAALMGKPGALNTSFEDFTLGSIQGQNGWVGQYGNWVVADSTPATGLQHVETVSDGFGQTIMLSPTFASGVGPVRSAAVKFRVSAGGVTWDWVPQDTVAGSVITRVRVNQDLSVSFLESDGVGGGVFTPTGYSMSVGQYVELGVEVDSTTFDIEIFADGVSIGSGTGFAGGINQVVVLSLMETAGPTLFTDDVAVADASFGPPVPALTLGTVTDLDACASNPGNNNGIIEPGEVVNLTIPLAAANGDYNNVVGTLSSTTPGVTILTGVGSYGIIADGSSVSANYSIGVDGGVACGSAIDLSLAVSSDEGSFTFPLDSRTVGNAGGPLSFPVAVGTPIPDNNVGGLDSTATVSGVSGPITNVSARVTATHTWVGDVRIQLTSPGGTTITLLDRPGVPASTYGCSADNINILFADGQPDPESLCNTGVWAVTDASPVPGDAFADFSGEDANGTWTLNINDNGPGDTGSLVSWELFVEPGAPAVCNVCLSDPDIQINVGSVNFGTVTFGSAAPVQFITISNAGDGPGTVGAPVFSGPFAQSGGTCPAAPFVLNPGDSCTIGIAFNGTTVGSYSGTVTIDGAGTPIVVNLAAVIAAAPPVFIPVSSPWMLGLMFALMGLVAGIVVVRRRG